MSRAVRFSRRLVLLFFFTLKLVYAEPDLAQLSDTYIQRWIDFYPSEAYTYGNKEAAFRFENFSEERVLSWLDYNHRISSLLSTTYPGLSTEQKIDQRVLLRQALSELERWQHDRVLENQAIYYAELISQALTYLLVRDQFSAEEKVSILLTRLEGVKTFCRLGQRLLENGSQERTRRALKVLEQTAGFYEQKLPLVAAEWTKEKDRPAVEQQIGETVVAINDFSTHIRERVLPLASIPDKFEAADYARKLKINIDSDITPEKLKLIAMQDIEETRVLMQQLASSWWQQEYSDSPAPENPEELLKLSMNAMESERQDNREDFLEFFVRLTNEAEAFVIQHNLATVPQPATLKVALSPDHFSGAAYGGVYPTGPFNPDATTLFYLPSIPDSSSEEQKSGFYRSFNTHFNTMIIAHEMLPGHYLQYKVGVSTAPPLRSLFANGVYVEGWGTFSEELMLDTGWGKGKKLTRLAHLRKRLENATRAYVSVMVHYEGWEKHKVIDFATERGLLAPQFAINLWNRVMNSPLQITNYFLGFHAFRQLWEQQKMHLGDDFNTRNFVDGVLRAGPIPIDTLPDVLHAMQGPGTAAP